MISSKQHDNKFLGTIVDSLSSMKYPHEMEGGFSIAEKYAKKIVNGMNAIKKLIVETKEVAYVQGSAELSAALRLILYWVHQIGTWRWFTN